MVQLLTYLYAHVSPNDDGAPDATVNQATENVHLQRGIVVLVQAPDLPGESGMDEGRSECKSEGE